MIRRFNKFSVSNYDLNTTQCGNFTIFLSLRFYVKSGDARSTKSAILTRFGPLDFNFYVFFCPLWSVKLTKKSKLKVSKIEKRTFLELLHSSKLISRKIWMTEKSWNFHTAVCMVQSTVWKFRDFSVTQILREINFEECRSSETAILQF